MTVNPTSNFRRSLVAVLFGLALGPVAMAQTWPAKVVRIIVPYGPGGAVDVTTRRMAQKLTAQTGQTFIVENRAGATGTIGAMQVARAEPDGYTLMANDTTYALLPHIFRKLPFDHDHDLLPVAAYVFAPMALAVPADSPFKTLKQLVDEAAAHPGKLSYGSGGAGTTPHFAMEALAGAAGVKFMHVPFKGAAEATQAVLAHNIDMQMASSTGVMGHVQGGKMRLLAISGDKRLAALPAVPTFREAGVKWDGVVNWTGLWAPKGTPQPVIDRLQKEVATAMASPDMVKFAEGLGAQPREVGAAEFGRMLRQSTDFWGKVAASTGFERQ